MRRSARLLGSAPSTRLALVVPGLQDALTDAVLRNESQREVDGQLYYGEGSCTMLTAVTTWGQLIKGGGRWATWSAVSLWGQLARGATGTSCGCQAAATLANGQLDSCWLEGLHMLSDIPP